MWLPFFRQSHFNITEKARELKLRLTPYSLDDLNKFSNSDLQRINDSRNSMLQRIWDGKEYAFFCSDERFRCYFDQLVEVDISWERAVAMGREKEYVSFQIARSDNVVSPRKYIFLDDYEDYLNVRVINSYHKALANDCLGEYFSGIRFFPKVPRRAHVVYGDDYNEYILSLDRYQLFDLYKKYRDDKSPLEQNYTLPTEFFGVAIDQYELYSKVFDVIKGLDFTVYIPGDGIGIGSFICATKGIKYYSSEPSPIGYESVSIGLITSCSGYSRLDADRCDCVFLGNVANYLNDDFKGMRVFQVDENPKIDGKWFTLGDSRIWSNFYKDIIFKDMKIRYKKILINLSEKYSLVPQDQFSRTAVQFLDLKVNLALPKLNICVKVISHDNCYNIFTRGFSHDYSKGRPGQEKDLGDIVTISNQPSVLDGFYGSLNFGKYSTVVLKKYVCCGNVFQAKLSNPYIYHYVQLGEDCKRVICVYFDKKTHQANFMLASDYAYIPNKLKLEVGKGLDIDLDNMY